DAVMRSTSGRPLLDEPGVDALVRVLPPRTTLLTPNADEAARPAGRPLRTEADAHEAARRAQAPRPRAGRVKGGHLDGDPVDVLYAGVAFHPFPGARRDPPHPHGTGCTYASAIAANLALGRALVDAVAEAKRFVTEAIRHGLDLG